MQEVDKTTLVDSDCDSDLYNFIASFGNVRKQFWVKINVKRMALIKS
jgi:hypothetical protein